MNHFDLALALLVKLEYCICGVERDTFRICEPELIHLYFRYGNRRWARVISNSKSLILPIEIGIPPLLYYNCSGSLEFT